MTHQMATKKKVRDGANVSPFFVTSTFTLDVEVDPAFLQDLSIAPAITSDGKAVMRLATTKGGKLCVNMPEKMIKTKTEADECATRSFTVILDGPTTHPWRIRLARTKVKKPRKK